MPLVRRTFPKGAVTRHPLGLSASAFAAVLWGFGGIFAALTYAPGVVVAFYRLWVGAGVLIVLTYSTRRRFTWSTMLAALPGGAFLAGDMTMFYSAVRLASIVDVTVIGAFQPAIVLVVGRRLLGERLTQRDVFWIVLAMAGVVVAVVGHGQTSSHQTLGDLLALGALLSFTSYWLVSKNASESHDAMTYTAGVTLMAAVVVTPVVLLSGESLGHVHPGDWVWVALLVLVPGTGHLVMNWAHRYVEASISSAISCLSPLVAAVAAVPILGQSLRPVQVVGVVAGLAALAVIAARHRVTTVAEVPISRSRKSPP